MESIGNLVFKDCQSRISGLETFSNGKVAFLRLHTDDGLEGWGQFGGKDVDITVELFHRRVAPAVFGQKISYPFELISSIVRFELNYKMMGVQLSKAIAGLDSAVWDTLGKYYNKSVCELLSGNCPKPFPCYASSISRKIKPKELAAKLVELRNQHGIDAFKVKIGKRMGNGEDEWAGRTEAVISECRSKLGEGSLIGVDANGAFDDVEQAKRVALLLEEKSIWFLEEPFPWMMYEKYEKLQEFLTGRNTSLFLAGGEQEFRIDIWEFIMKRLFPWKISQPDCGYCGGPTTALLIDQLSAENGIKFMPHSPQGDLMPVICWQLLCASPNAASHMELACVDDGIAQIMLDSKTGIFQNDYFQPAIQVERGMFKLLSSTSIVGWGIKMNENFIKNSTRISFSDTTADRNKRSFL